ncbi:rRNA maturation RNase YbeY [Candidatus Shapirobacteria bacterium]|nr:rRNA maturation RNase YbeY [Candidatus Shapirobacteria bacterium]
MISILIASGSRYPVGRKKIKEKAGNFLAALGMDQVEVSILVGGDRLLRNLNRQFRELDEVSEVLAFPQEGKRGPDGVLYLGDVVISYPAARRIAMEENKRVDEIIEELVVHGLNNLTKQNGLLSKIPTTKA